MRFRIRLRTGPAMKPLVYAETTIPSYLTSRPSRDLIRAADEVVAREWWARRESSDLFVLPRVSAERSAGDPAFAAAWLAALAGIPLPHQADEATASGEAPVRGVPLPPEPGEPRRGRGQRPRQ